MTQAVDTVVHVTLPWPDRQLSPNARGHWSVLARARKRAKAQAMLQAYEVGLDALAVDLARSGGTGTIAVELQFHPPDRRERDDDNLVASCKAMLDGIASVMGVNDSRFRIAHSRHDPYPGGMVKVIVRW
jgi:hypothetical protein